MSSKSSRRRFLKLFGTGALLFGTGAVLSRTLSADPAKIAARIEKAEGTHPLMPAIEKAYASLQKLDEVKDYTATFTKQEKIGRSLVKAQMELKLREEPFSVYLKFVSPSAGREVLFVEGQNKNMLYAHDVGFRGLAGTLSLDPEGSMAMDGNRHPATMIGMRKMVTEAAEQWLNEMKYSEAKVNVFANSQIGKTACTVIESSYAKQLAGVKFQMTRLYIDNENGLPIRIQQYDFPGRRDREATLAEDYLYTNLRTNIGLNDADFDVKNRSYNF
ncbi:MAG: DUF1571 domain-containing protein [Planctomycetaceae bacterium]|nr:DUF1571 domain-containing protein [Planctomycetaceae bacterium]MCB9949954.1 DUF1571 domain-containing protein [Planctomycetaceae bacterium]